MIFLDQFYVLLFAFYRGDKNKICLEIIQPFNINKKADYLK